VLVATQLSVPGLYLPSVFKRPLELLVPRKRSFQYRSRLPCDCIGQWARYYKKVEEVETFCGFRFPWSAGTLSRIPKACWSWGYVSALDSHGRTIWIADAHCDDGKRFVCRTFRITEKAMGYCHIGVEATWDIRRFSVMHR